jgi:PilZ domain
MLALNNRTSMLRPAPRRAERRPLALPGRVTWKDSRGATRFASVVTRNVSETGIFIEWSEPASIPMYRLVNFQLERDARNVDGVPPALRDGKVLTVVYRVGAFQRSTGTPEGYGLRLLVEPSLASRAAIEPVEATA